jgi:hypothetical protein
VGVEAATANRVDRGGVVAMKWKRDGDLWLADHGESPWVTILRDAKAGAERTYEKALAFQEEVATDLWLLRLDN